MRTAVYKDRKMLCYSQILNNSNFCCRTTWSQVQASAIVENVPRRNEL